MKTPGLSTVRAARCIFVLGNGGLLESGSHEELVAGDGHYAKLLKRQLAGGESFEPKPLGRISPKVDVEG